MLQFGMKPPISYADFLEQCAQELSLCETEELKEDRIPLLKKWKIFDISLRNELVRTRAVKKGKDPNNYLRVSDGIDPFIAPLAHWAVNQDSLMDAERYLLSDFGPERVVGANQLVEVKRYWNPPDRVRRSWRRRDRMRSGGSGDCTHDGG